MADQLPRVQNPGSRTGKARAVKLAQAAQRAVDDRAQLERAVRIVRLALAQGRITLEDLQDGGEQ